MLRKLFFGALLSLSAIATPAVAQTSNAYGTIIRIPIVANTSTYTSTIFIHNPTDLANGTINVLPIYYGAVGTATGAVACTLQTLASGETKQVNFASICPLGAGWNFGQVYLYEIDAANHPFAAYSRVEAFSGNGFSVEGFPPSNFHNNLGSSYVTGLKRQAAFPTYQTNCFVAALNEPVTVLASLRSSTNVTIGTPTNYVLAANQTIRLLDIFATLGAPAGDYSNVTAAFSENLATGEPAFMAYCTVQNNTSFDADFRIAKEAFTSDIRTKRSQSASFDALGNAFTLQDSFTKNIHVAYMTQPDWVQCQITGANTAGLEFQLKNPAGIVVAGGDNINLFTEVYIGDNDLVVGGSSIAGTGRWIIEISSNGSAVTPATYGFACQSGNGMTPFDQIGTGPDDF